MLACVGEVLIDKIGSKQFIGGCPFNVAKAASRLGANVAFFGKVSSDSYGQMILESMIDDCVMFDPSLCNAKERTMLSVAKLDGDGKATYEFDYRSTAASTITFEELANSFSMVSDIDMVFFGSTALVMEPGSEAIVPAIESIKSKPRLFLDPNVRPAMIRDAEAYRKMILALASKCTIVRVSDEDLDFLYPDISREISCSQLRALCPNLIVTHGENGSTWFTRSLQVESPASHVEKVVDTIGCGDTFNGAVASYIQENSLIDRLENLDEHTVREMLSFASKAAAMNCLKEGCDPPFRSQL